MPALAAPRILLPGARWTGPATITIDAGRITRITDGIDPAAEYLPAATLTPGLIDLHNNGAFGIDFATAAPADWPGVLAALATRGVTAIQPTIITAPLPDLLAALDRLAALPQAPATTRILGTHMEGPFLSPRRPGAHDPTCLRLPTPDAIDALLAHPATPRTITLAPELPGALPAIARLAQAGVIVALGHSDATAEQAHQAADAGATMVTHLFNAMRPLHHRDPALPGAALTDPRLWCCLIIDGQHVDPLACRIAFAAAPARIVAVTDSIAIAGMPPGTTRMFGNHPVMSDQTGLGRRPDGTIAGAGITLDEGIRRMIRAGIDPAQALRSATESPAAALRRPDLGRIAPGAQADLVCWDDHWTPRRVWIAGQDTAP